MTWRRTCLPWWARRSAGKAADEVRHDYWMTITELFVENFSQQIGQ